VAQLLVLPSAASPFRAGRWAVTAALLAWAVAVRVVAARRGGLELPWHPLAAVLAVLPALAALSAAWSPAPLGSLASAGASAAWLGAVAVMAGLGERWFGRCAAAAVLATATSAAVGVGQRLGVSPLTVEPASGGGRFAVVGLAGNPADLAAAALAASLVAVAAPGPSRRLRAVAVAVLLAGIAATATLAAAAGLLLAAVAWTLLVLGASRRVRLALLAVTVAVGGAALAPRVPALLGAVRAGDWYALLSARADGWTAAAEMVRERPVGGVGAAGYGCRYASARLAWLERHGGTGRRGELATHFQWAHCEPLQVAAELGLLGVLWMGAAAWAAARGRPSLGPWAAVVAAGLAPVALLHYPTRVAAVMAPVAVLVAGLLRAAPRRRVRVGWMAAAVVAAVAVALAAGAVVTLRWQRWLGAADRALAAAPSLPPAARGRVALGVERGALEWARRPYPEPCRAWRVAGRARLLRGAPGRAEAAFREADRCCPHEEAWLGLGLALAARGRTTEAMPHLAAACRINPALLVEVPEGALREAVRAALGLPRPRPGPRRRRGAASSPER